MMSKDHLVSKGCNWMHKQKFKKIAITAECFQGGLSMFLRLIKSTSCTISEVIQMTKVYIPTNRETLYLLETGTLAIVQKREKDNSGFTDIDAIEWDEI